MARLRRARLNDVPKLVRIERACFDHDLIEAQEWYDRLADPEQKAWLLETGSADAPRPLGLLLVKAGRHNLRILDIAVVPARRGQGHGARLLRHASRTARRLDKKRITLEVARKNGAALHLYKKAGFRRIGTLPQYFESGADAIRLALELDE